MSGTGCGSCRPWRHRSTRTALPGKAPRPTRRPSSSRLAAAGPLTIADGHHRYETALRYRDERRMSRSCEEDPAFDYVLALLLESTGQTLTVLPTHRLVGGLEDGRGRAARRGRVPVLGRAGRRP